MSDPQTTSAIPGKTKKRGGLFRSARAQCGLLYAVLTILVTALFVVSLIPKKYSLLLGQVPNVTITATKDVVDEITTETRRTEAANRVQPVTVYSDEVKPRVMTKLDQIYSQLAAVRQFSGTLEKEQGNDYSREELQYAASLLTVMVMNEHQLRTLMNASQEDFDALCESMYSMTDLWMNTHFTSEQLEEVIRGITSTMGTKFDTALVQNVALPVLRECIEPNMVLNEAETEKARQKARDDVEPVVIMQGQNIVVKGEGRVTASQLGLLRSLGLLGGDQINLAAYAGSSVLGLAVMILLYLVLSHISVGLTREVRRMLILCLVMGGTLILSAAARMLNLYLMPLLLAVLLLTALDSVRAGLSVNTALSALMLIFILGFSENDSTSVIRVTLMTLIGGTAAGMIMRKSGSRFKPLIAGVAAAVLNFITVVGLTMITVSSWTDVWQEALLSMAGPVLAGLLAMALQPILESAFNLPTTMRLLELSNPNSPLLKRLMIEAPGTYHHSILVANLAEASAEAVGANPVLARVGAYYHDIGKLKRPQYFSENQAGGENAHDHTEPEISAKILTSHTRDGLALAREYRLPVEIQQIVANHHGNSPVMYFYHKAVQQANGTPVDINLFRYEGNKPSTKEEAIIMLCDTIEAAVRSRKDSMTQEELTGYIVKLVRGKLSDGQLNNAPLTLQDIDKICTACTIVLKGVNHERVAYPGDKQRNDRGARRRQTALPAQPKQKPAEAAAPAPVTPPPSPESLAVDAMLQDQPKPEEIETENAPAYIPAGRDVAEDIADETPEAEPAEEGNNEEPDR